jgi:hypothetical protein
MRKLDPVELEHVEQVVRSNGYQIIRHYIQDEAMGAGTKIMQPGMSHEETQYLRGYYRGLLFAIGAGKAILEAHKDKKT